MWYYILLKMVLLFMGVGIIIYLLIIYLLFKDPVTRCMDCGSFLDNNNNCTNMCKGKEAN